MKDDYAARYSRRDREYAAAYNSPEARAWIESLDPAERKWLQADGLLKPLFETSGTGGIDEDLADSPTASYTPDYAEEIDRAEKPAPRGDDAELRADTLASFCARIRSCDNPLLVFDAVCYATGVLALDGKSQTELAKAHGVTRAAFSRIATQWCKTFGIKPSRGMKSERARKAYERRARADWERRAALQTRDQIDTKPMP